MQRPRTGLRIEKQFGLVIKCRVHVALRDNSRLHTENPRLAPALLVAVHLNSVSDTEFNSSLAELADLAKP